MKPISYGDLLTEIGMMSRALREISAHLTQLRDRALPAVKPPPKSWLQMETELLGLRDRVVSVLYFEEHWSYRRIAKVLAVTPENVRRRIDRLKRKQRMSVVRQAWVAKAAALKSEQREALLAQSPRVLRVGTWTGSQLDQFRSLSVLCNFTVPQLTKKIGVKRVREVRNALAEHGLCLKEDSIGLADNTDEDGSPSDADNDPDA